MVEEPGDGGAAVDGGELVEGTIRQAVGHDPGRGAGAGGHEHGARRDQAGRKGQGREAFADGCGVDPGEAAFRAGQGGLAPAFGEAFGGYARGGEPGVGAAERRVGEPPRKRAVEAERQRDRSGGHQPPVWLIWRDIWPPSAWRE